MGIYRSKTIWVKNVNSPAKTKRFYLNAGNITIGRRIYRQDLPRICFYIKPQVIVIGPQFAKIAGKSHGYIERIAEITLGVVRRLKDLSNQRRAVQ
jgi:hypothetical protein